MAPLLRLAAIAALGFGLAERPALAGQDLFLVDLASDPASLDPHVQWDPDSYAVYRNVFDNLLTRDQSGKIVPQVATAWRYANDTTVVFDLRTDIKFQDGTKLTPDDVVFSVQRITTPAFKSPQLSQFDQIIGAEVSGPSQVTLHTKSPYPVLLSQLTKLSIVPRAIVQKVGDVAFNQAPVGSGPYRFVSREQGVKIELAAMPSYWRGTPPFPRVEMHPVPAESTRIADLRTGRADITRILSTDNADQLRGDSQLNVLWTPTERVTMLTLNALAGPTADPRVRAAISHAIDQNLIVEALLKGYAKPVPEPLTPASFGYAPDIAPYKFDPDQAKTIIKDAGVKPGAKLDFLTSPIFDQRVVQALQQMLADVGFDPQIRSVDAATYLRLRQGRPDEAGDVSYFRWSCGCQDADGTLFPLFHSSSQWAKYRNPAVDSALEAARNTLDEKARLGAYHTALEHIGGDVAVVPLFQDVIMFAARKPVHFQPTANEAFFLMDISWR
ncbi:MAG TPA: ABC transporter substrate-binding protein [Acetobacteraceae bacterium]|jgi:peptide/nickel transport system substrate-binding protein|nr:ABC transporter substrate-binding protein [Acetobacteraceae bacterium]